ncbi:MAG: hypothetical protein ABI051_01410 [Vicinamibacterales bacterium]
MTKQRMTTCALALVMVCGGVAKARASDPVGVYAVVDRIVLTPNTATGGTVQVWGTFLVATPHAPGNYPVADAYSKPQKGYLLYTCPAGKASTCTAEWNDLKSVAGTSQIVAFGTRWEAPSRVRLADEAAKSPDVYSLNTGVTKMNPANRTGEYTALFSALDQAAAKR